MTREQKLRRLEEKIEAGRRKFGAEEREIRTLKEWQRILRPVWAEHPGWTIGQCIEHLRATALTNVAEPSSAGIKARTEGRA